jgi:hypothetical protein
MKEHGGVQVQIHLILPLALVEDECSAGCRSHFTFWKTPRNILSSSMLSKNVKINIYRSII